MTKYELKTTMYTWSTVIFPGFYESILFNSDSISMLNADDTDKEYDVNFEEFTKDVTMSVSRKLFEECTCNNILKDINYIGISSPKEYNYNTDRLILEVTYNIRNLIKFCFRTAKTEFNEYLHDNYTSYDGFTSFVPNNLEEFKRDLHDAKEYEKLIEVMIEYVMLVCLNDDNRYTIDLDDCNFSMLNYSFDKYREELFEISQDSLYKNSELACKEL